MTEYVGFVSISCEEFDNVLKENPALKVISSLISGAALNPDLSSYIESVYGFSEDKPLAYCHVSEIGCYHKADPTLLTPH